MNKRKLLSRILSVVGLAMLVIAAVSFVAYLTTIVRSGWFGAVILFIGIFFPVIGSGLAALGAFLGKSRYRIFLSVALGLILCGEMAYLAALGNMDNPYLNFPTWWPLLFFTYPIGAIMSFVGAVRMLIEYFHKSPIAQDGV